MPHQDRGESNGALLPLEGPVSPLLGATLAVSDPAESDGTSERPEQ